MKWSRAVEVLQRNASEAGGKHPRQENSYIVWKPPKSRVWLSLVTFSEGPKTTWGRFVTELAWSADLHSWHRVCAGTPFIPFGENSTDGGWDSSMILAAAAPFPDPHDPNRTRVYYVGTDGPWKSRRDNSIGLGWLPTDHWAGYEAPAAGAAARVMTVPIAVRRLSVRLTVDVTAASGGWVMATITGPSEQGGKQTVASRRIVESMVDGHLLELPGLWLGQQVVLHFSFSGAVVFGFSV